jgi:YidC/Oxa1 family membrane protein insertase
MSVPLLDDAVSFAYPIVFHLAQATGPAAAIVLGTVAIRLLLLPLVLAAVRGERARAALAPRVAELRTRHARNPERLRAELAELYRETGTSPFAGCLPVLLQAPFFLVTYRLFASPTIGGQANALLHSKLFGVALSAHLLGGGFPLVFLPLLAALAGLAWLTVRRIRRLAGPDAPRGPLALLPYGTVLTAAVVPLAAVLYLVTSTAWTAVENAVLRRPR